MNTRLLRIGDHQIPFIFAKVTSLIKFALAFPRCKKARMPTSLGFRLQFGLRIKRRAGAPGYLSTATLLVASGFHLGIQGSVEDVSVGVLPEIVSALLGYSPKVSRCVPPFGSASTL